MKKKVSSMSLIVLAIVFVVYNLFVFLFLNPVTPVFWVSYGFMILAFLLQIVGMYLSFKDFSVRAVFFGIPLAQFTLFYFCAELFMSVVFMIFQSIPVKIPVFLQVVLLAVYAIVAIVSVVTRDTVVQVEQKYQNAASNNRMNRAAVESICDMVSDPELKKQMRQLAEVIRYSDPMTSSAVAELETRIQQEIGGLQFYCQNGRLEEAKASCTMLQRLYAERNRMLLAAK